MTPVQKALWTVDVRETYSEYLGLFDSDYALIRKELYEYVYAQGYHGDVMAKIIPAFLFNNWPY